MKPINIPAVLKIDLDSSEEIKKGIAEALEKANKDVMDALEKANKDVNDALEKTNKDVEEALAQRIEEKKRKESGFCELEEKKAEPRVDVKKIVCAKIAQMPPPEMFDQECPSDGISAAIQAEVEDREVEVATTATISAQSETEPFKEETALQVEEIVDALVENIAEEEKKPEKNDEGLCEDDTEEFVEASSKSSIVGENIEEKVEINGKGKGEGVQETEKGLNKKQQNKKRAKEENTTQKKPQLTEQ